MGASSTTKMIARIKFLIKVGNDTNWQIYGTPFCGKGEPNQAISVGHGSPVCEFANVEVFGGG